MAAPIASDVRAEEKEEINLAEVEAQELTRIHSLELVLGDISTKKNALRGGGLPRILVQSAITNVLRQIITEENEEELLLQRINRINSDLQFRIGRLYQLHQANERTRFAAAQLKIQTNRLISGIYEDLMMKRTRMNEVAAEINTMEHSMVENGFYGIVGQIAAIEKRLKIVEGLIKNIQQRLRMLEKAQIVEENIVQGRVPKLF
ncbi:MAG TPA: hypothetical protein VJ110_03500 [Candidatus Nanoarchaeia archaeon]|nr:hypothetical protein [Candidatus Nanoarchaeia archaeon]